MLLGLAMLCYMPIVQGQDTLRIDLSKAIEIGLSTSPTILIAEKQLERVDYSKKERLAGLLPSISGGGSYQRALKKQRMFFTIPGMQADPNGIEVGQDNSFVGDITANLPIIAPTLWATLRLNEVDLQMAYEASRSSKIQLVHQITKAYYSILLMQESYNVFEKNYKFTLESTNVIANKYKLGSTSEFEWLRADVQLRNAANSLMSAESAIAMSKLQLITLMGLPIETEIEVLGSLAEYENELYAELMKIDLKGLDKNTDIRQIDLRADQLEKSLEIHKSSFLPTLGAQFKYQYMAMADDNIKLANYRWFPISNVGISLSIPIFQGGARVFKQKQIELQKEELKFQKTNLRKNLELQVLMALENMKKSIDKIDLNKKALQQAEKALKISDKMYELGTGTFIDNSNSKLALVQAGLSFNQSIFDFISAKADLEKILGNSFNE